jgi:hypothetical protein
MKEHDRPRVPEWKRCDDSESAWASRGKFLFSLLVEESMPGNDVRLAINDQSARTIWAKPDGTERDYIEAIDHAIYLARLEDELGRRRRSRIVRIDYGR